MTHLNLSPLLTMPGSNMNPNSPRFHVSSDLNLIHKAQFTNPNNDHVRPSTSYHTPRNLNNQVETNINYISSHSTRHTLYPNVIVKPPGLPYSKTQAEN